MRTPGSSHGQFYESTNYVFSEIYGFHDDCASWPSSVVQQCVARPYEDLDESWWQLQVGEAVYHGTESQVAHNAPGQIVIHTLEFVPKHLIKREFNGGRGVR